MEAKKVLDGREDLFYSECRDVQAIVPGLAAITRPMMEKSSHLLIIAAHGVGYNNVDIASADDLGILLSQIFRAQTPMRWPNLSSVSCLP